MDGKRQRLPGVCVAREAETLRSTGAEPQSTLERDPCHVSAWREDSGAATQPRPK